MNITPKTSSPSFAACLLPTQWGEFEMRVLPEEGLEPVILSMGCVDDGEPFLTRL